LTIRPGSTLTPTALNCWSRIVYKELLRVTGGKERIRAFDEMRPSGRLLSDGEIADIHRIKTARYAELIAAGGCTLRPGVVAMLELARERSQRLAHHAERVFSRQ
jgi:hypothetical protein